MAPSNRPSRREFVSGAAITAAGLIAAACGATPTATPLPTATKVPPTATSVPPTATKAPAPAATTAPATAVPPTAVPPTAVPPTATAVPSKAPPTVEIRFSHWWDSLDDDIKILNGKGWKIKQEVTPWDGYHVKTLTQMAGGTASDLVMISSAYSNEFVIQKVLYPLEGALTAASMDPKKWGHDPYLGLADGGKLYGISQYYQFQPGLIANMRVLDKEGIKIPKLGDADFDSWTWDSFLALCKQLVRKDADGKFTRTGMNTGAGLGAIFWGKLARHVNFFGADEFSFRPKEALVTSPEFLQIADEAMMMQREGLCVNAASMVKFEGSAFRTDHSAFAITQLGPVKFAQDLPVYYLSLPRDKGKATEEAAGDYLTVNNRSKVADAAAAAMMAMYTDPDLQKIQVCKRMFPPMYDSSKVLELLPVDGPTKGFEDVQPFNLQNGKGGARYAMEVCFCRSANVRPGPLSQNIVAMNEPMGRAPMEFRDRFTAACDEMVLDKRPVKDIWTDAKKDLDKILQAIPKT